MNRDEQRRAIEELRRTIPVSADREALGRAQRQKRLAITVPDPNTGLYPAEADLPNTYWIVFVDGSYPKTQGRQSHTLVARQKLDAARALAHSLDEGAAAYCPVYSFLEVGWHNRQWWFSTAGTPSTSSGSSSSGSSSSGSSSSGSSSSGSSGSSSGSSGPPCANTIGGVALSAYPNYDASKKQALIHNQGCLEWMTIGPC